MGGEYSCVCSGGSEKDFNQYLITIENKISKKEKEDNSLEELFDIERNRKFVIIDINNLEGYINTLKNYIVPSNNLIKIAEIIYYYNRLIFENYLFNKNKLVLIMEFVQKYRDGICFKNNLTFLKNIKFKVDEVNLISWDTSRIIELIDINITANLRRKYILTCTAVNYKEFRSHKFLYRKIKESEKQNKYHISVFNQIINKENLEEFLNQNNDKKLISVILDYYNSCLYNKYFTIFKKNNDNVQYEYLVNELVVKESSSFLTEINKSTRKLDNVIIILLSKPNYALWFTDSIKCLLYIGKRLVYKRFILEKFLKFKLC